MMNFKIYLTTVLACILLLYFPKSFYLVIISFFSTLVYAIRIRRLLYSGISRKSLYLKYVIPNIINVLCISITVGVIIFTKGDSFFFQTSTNGLIKSIIFTVLYLSSNIAACSVFFFSAWDKPFSIFKGIVCIVVFGFCSGICFGIEELVFSMNFHLVLITICTLVFNPLFYIWFKRVQID